MNQTWNKRRKQLDPNHVRCIFLSCACPYSCHFYVSEWPVNTLFISAYGSLLHPTYAKRALPLSKSFKRFQAVSSTHERSLHVSVTFSNYLLLSLQLSNSQFLCLCLSLNLSRSHFLKWSLSLSLSFSQLLSLIFSLSPSWSLLISWTLTRSVHRCVDL